MNLSSMLGMSPPVIPATEEELPKPKKISPFDYTSSISYTKENLMVDEDAERQYNAYMVNRALSFGADTVLFANEVNKYPQMPKQMQYQFLIGTIRKKKRYDTWQKADSEHDDINVIKEYYGYSSEKAKQALSLLTPEQISQLKDRMFKGGLLGKKNAKK